MRKNSLIWVKVKPDTWKWYYNKFLEWWNINHSLGALEVRGQAMFLKKNIGLVFQVIREDDKYYYLNHINGCEFNTIRKELFERVHNHGEYTGS